MKYPYVNFMDGCNMAHEALACFSQNGVNPVMDFKVYNCYLLNDSFHNTASCSALYQNDIHTSLNNIVIAPNPASDHIWITAEKGFDNNTTIAVYDVTGRCVLLISADAMKEVSVSTTSWSNGLYMVIIQNNSGVIKKEKIVIAK